MVKCSAALFGAALVLGISSCSVRNNFEGQPVPPAREAPPLRLSLAVLSDPSLTFDYPPIYSLSDFKEVMNPGLAETLRNGFGPGFQQVAIVESESDAAQMDLLATPAIEVADPMTLTVTFTEPGSGRQITRCRRAAASMVTLSGCIRISERMSCRSSRFWRCHRSIP